MDGILDNQTELAIERHTTDTVSYTETVFALFDLLGLSFEPRLKDLGDQYLYTMAGIKSYSRGFRALSMAPLMKP